MPPGFDWQKIMELGKNPGLGTRSLHTQGITGQGVGLAIIDQPLIVDHPEYADRMQLYEEINIAPHAASEMHGPAVASIAVGKTTGVAPEADLYYIACYAGDFGPGGPANFTYNFHYIAQGIQRILDINRQLPEGRKIRVISISVGWSPENKGYDEVTAAVKVAKAAGLLWCRAASKRLSASSSMGWGARRWPIQIGSSRMNRRCGGRKSSTQAIYPLIDCLFRWILEPQPARAAPANMFSIAEAI